MTLINANAEQLAKFLTDPYPSEQSAVTKAVHQAFEAGRNKRFDELDACHLFGPKFSKFDDWEPLARQDGETAWKTVHAGFSSMSEFNYKVQDLKVDVFGDVAVATFVLDYKMKVGKDAGKWKITHEHFSPFKSNP